MTRAIWRALQALAIVAVAFALSACPPLIEPSVLLYAEDGVVPVITVDNPTNRAAFDSSVLFVGTVTDSAATAGDLQGKVVSLTYAVVDHSSLDGTAALGDDGSFSFTIDTHDLSGDQTVILTATDWNGNIGELLVEITDPGVGPDIAISSPTANSIYLSTVTVAGVVNNRAESVAVTEVGSLRYEVLGSSINGGVEFSPSDGAFSFNISTVGLTGRIVIRLTATDKNGRASQTEVELMDRSEGPTLTVSSPQPYTSYQASVTFTGAVTNKDDPSSTSEVSLLAYQILGKTAATSVPFTAGTGAFSFSFPTVDMDGNLIIQLTALDKNGRSTVLDYTLLENLEGPRIIIDPALDSTNYAITITLAGRVRNSESDTTHFDDVNTSSVSYTLQGGTAVPITLDSNAAFSVNISTIGRSGTISLKVSASDMNGHVTQESITMYDNLPGPTVTITQAPQYYSSAATTSITVAGTVSSPDTLLDNRMAYTVTHSAGSFSDYIDDPEIDAGGVFSFAFAMAQTPAVAGTATVTITATDSGGREKQQTTVVYDDPTAPFIITGRNDDNTYIEVTFYEAVYTLADGTGVLTPGDFRCVFDAKGGTATGATLTDVRRTDGSALIGGEQAVRVIMSVVGIPAGVETVTILPALPPPAAIYDHVGNPMAAGATTGALTLKDAKAPVAPGAPDLATADDTGRPGVSGDTTDNVTSNTSNLTFSGTGAELSSTVKLYRAGTILLGFTTDTSTGSWTIDNVTLAEGTHQITAETTDSSGNTSPASAAIEVVVDTTPPSAPSVPVLDAADDKGTLSTDHVTNQTTNLTFRGTGDTSDGRVYTIYLYDSPDLVSPLGTADSATSEWTVDPVSLGAGGHSIMARAVDKAGNYSLTYSDPPREVTIDTTPPGTPDTPDLTTDTGVSATDNVTNAASISFYISGVEVGGQLTLSSSIDESFGTVETANTYHTYSALTLSAGIHTITAHFVDKAGNACTSDSTLSVTVDGTPPGAPDTPDLTTDTGVSTTDNVTNAPSISFYVSGVEVGGQLTLSSNIDGSFGTVVTASAYHTYSALSLSAGIHTITAHFVDKAGNVCTSDSTLSVTVDRTPPGVPGLALTTDNGVSGTDNLTNSVTIEVTGIETGGELSLESDLDGSLGTVYPISASYTYEDLSLSDGDHTITAHFMDKAGNDCTADGSLDITVDTDPPGQPTVDLLTETGVDPEDDVINTTSASIEVTGIEAGGELTLSGSANDPHEEAPTAAISYTFTGLSLLEGTYAVTAHFVDAAGNACTSDGTLSITLDTDGPAVADVYVGDGTTPLDYYLTEPIPVHILFSEPVYDVSDPEALPTLELALTGTPTATCSVVDGTDTVDLSYTVQSGDASIALDYVDADSLVADMTDAAGNALDTALAPTGDPGSISDEQVVAVYDTTRP